nr:hypothetical protein [Methanobrevibacter smithii]
MGHDDCFDNYQLTIIVQEAFDECIKKYCNKTILEKGEEACRMKVGTIFEEYLPIQLKNHGFKSIEIKANSFIQGGTLFVDDDECNLVLKNRYKDEILPICKKCERIKNDDKCVVPNKRKDNNLPSPHVVKTIPIDLKNEKEEVDEGEDEDFYVEIIKLYFDFPEKSFKTAQRAMEAIDDILYKHGVGDFWTDFEVDDLYHEWDIICVFDDKKDRGRFKKLFMDYGFDIENAKDGFWITGVKE